MPKLISRRIFGTAPEFSGAAYKSDGDTYDDDDTDDGTEQTLLIRKIKKTVSRELATRATKEEVKEVLAQLAFLKPSADGKTPGLDIEALRTMADEKNGVMVMLTNQGVELQKLKQTMDALPKDTSIRSQCQAFITKNADAIKKIRNQEKADLPPFEIDIRAAADSPMTPSTVMPGGKTYISRTEIAPDINELLRPEPTFWDFIKKGNTNAETYVWLNKKPTNGAAAFIGPGVFKPAISFSVEAENSNAKKIAVSEKMATELLEDIDGFVTWVETELRYQLMQKVNDTLMSGVASSTVPAGIQTLSTVYDALTGVKTTTPTFWDAIKAAVTQLRVKRFRGQIVAFVNPVDLANGVLTKAVSQGQLFVPPVTGAVIVEDLNIPLGYVQVAAMDYYKILIYKAFRMAWGWENDDFTKNLVTVIGEMRFHQYHAEIYDGFAIYDTIQNIKDAITQA
jgi:hypothetical protein